MYLIYHFIFSVILSGFLWPILGWKLVLFWLGSFFVDIDHYWWYILKVRRFSLREAYIYNKNCTKNDAIRLHIFHIIEFWILLGIWSIFSEFAFAILIGVIFHVVLDLTDIVARNRSFLRTFSFFGWYYSPSNSTKVKTG